jgi:cupin fold WbuC family metalloprotein
LFFEDTTFMKIINAELLEKISQQAKFSSRKRQNYNFHETFDAVVQRMLNSIEPESYVCPHKHENPDKVEAFIVLKGKVKVIEFDDSGHIISHCTLSAEDGIYGSEIAPRIWHTVIALVPSIVYEVKEGPYSPVNDKNFAPWAPKEGEPGTREYISELLRRCR